MLHDDRDVLVATARFLRLLRDVYEGAANEAAETAAAARLAAAAAVTSELNSADTATASSPSPSSSSSSGGDDGPAALSPDMVQAVARLRLG